MNNLTMEIKNKMILIMEELCSYEWQSDIYIEWNWEFPEDQENCEFIELFTEEEFEGEVLYNRIYLSLGHNSKSYIANAGFCEEDVEYLYELFNSKIKVDTFDTPSKSFDSLELSHGLYTGFMGQFGISNEEGFQRLLNLQDNPQWEVCCSLKGQYIGDYGVIIKGEHKVVSNYDLFSFIEEGEGRTIPLSCRSSHIIQDIQDLDTTVCTHTEHIVVNSQIQRFWIKENKIEENKEIINLVEKHGLKVEVIPYNPNAAYEYAEKMKSQLFSLEKEVEYWERRLA